MTAPYLRLQSTGQLTRQDEHLGRRTQHPELQRLTKHRHTLRASLPHSEPECGDAPLRNAAGVIRCSRAQAAPPAGLLVQWNATMPLCRPATHCQRRAIPIRGTMSRGVELVRSLICPKCSLFSAHRTPVEKTPFVSPQNAS